VESALKVKSLVKILCINIILVMIAKYQIPDRIYEYHMYFDITHFYDKIGDYFEGEKEYSNQVYVHKESELDKGFKKFEYSLNSYIDSIKMNGDKINFKKLKSLNLSHNSMFYK